VALREVGISNALTDFLKAFIDRGAIPLFGFVPDPDAEQLTQAQADALAEKFMQRYGGLDRSWRPPFLQSIKSVERLGLDLDELAYPELRDIADAAICAAFGVPPGMVGAIVGLERNTFTNFVESREQFWQDTIGNLWSRIDDAFTRDLLPEFEARPGYVIQFDPSDVPALQEDVTPTWQRAGAAVAQGWVTVNDARREAGLPPVRGGDVFLRSIATVAEPAPEEGRRSAEFPVGSGWVDAVFEPLPDWDGRMVERESRPVNGNGHRPAEDRALFRLPPEARAAAAESHKTAIARLAELVGAPLYVVHVSCREALAEIERGRARGVEVLAETVRRLAY
jgi:hypothetical protein